MPEIPGFFILPNGQRVDLSGIAGVNTENMSGGKFKVEIVPKGGAEQIIEIIMDEEQMRAFSIARSLAQEASGSVDRILGRDIEKRRDGGRNNGGGGPGFS